MEEYQIKYYKNSRTGRTPVLDYMFKLDDKNRAKIKKYLIFLKKSNGYLEEPYSKHIVGKIRELRVGFGHNRHRIFYFGFINKKIIILSAFLKNTEETPLKEIQKALSFYYDTLNNPHYYE